MGKARILLVEDDVIVRQFLRLFLDQRYEVAEAASCAEAECLLRTCRIDAAVIDYRLPDGDALTLLDLLSELYSALPAVVLTAHGSIELAVEAMRRGAEHFLTKPAEPEALAVIIDRCLTAGRRRRRRRAYDTVHRRQRPNPFAGNSTVIQGLEKMAREVCTGHGSVLLRGETGCGKGLLARWLHDHGPRVDEPFVGLNCAGLKPELLESELFGYKPGAFTEAAEVRPGLLEVADRGTLFIDEIGDMDLNSQAKLLKVLEEQTFRRLGGVRDRRVDVRLIAASHHDLDALVKAEKFRADLYFRIDVLRLEIPPLRRRRKDIPTIIYQLLSMLSRNIGCSGRGIAPEAVEILARHSWPGNIRELRNVLERAVLLADGKTLHPADLHFDSHIATAS